jgi:hypothetical protein
MVEKEVSVTVKTPQYADHLVILCEIEGVSSETVEGNMEGVRCIRVQSHSDSIEERFENCALQIFDEIKKILTNKAAGKVLIQILIPGGSENRFFYGFSGMLRTAWAENPKIVGQIIEMEPYVHSERVVTILRDNCQNPEDGIICYRSGRRYVGTWKEAKVPEKYKKPWKNGGVYIITGGAGGLGLIFSKEIARSVKDAVLVLTGRSSLDSDKLAEIKELEKLGSRVVYMQGDITDKKEACRLVENVSRNFGGLNGIIHSAGIIHDNYIIKKSAGEFEEVMAPKVKGLVNLDLASKGISLDFFILFSSISGCLGSAGQADYSTGNAFMDAYAAYRMCWWNMDIERDIHYL